MDIVDCAFDVSLSPTLSFQIKVVLFFKLLMPYLLILLLMYRLEKKSALCLIWLDFSWKNTCRYYTLIVLSMAPSNSKEKYINVTYLKELSMN